MVGSFLLYQVKVITTFQQLSKCMYIPAIQLWELELMISQVFLVLHFCRYVGGIVRFEKPLLGVIFHQKTSSEHDSVFRSWHYVERSILSILFLTFSIGLPMPVPCKDKIFILQNIVRESHLYNN